MRTTVRTTLSVKLCVLVELTANPTNSTKNAMLWFAPRQAGSGWSKVNKDRIAKLLKAGLMTPAGLAKIDATKADGSWVKLDAISTLEQPTDLRSEFARYSSTKTNFESFLLRCNAAFWQGSLTPNALKLAQSASLKRHG